jgi:hypothetical protein
MTKRAMELWIQAREAMDESMDGPPPARPPPTASPTTSPRRPGLAPQPPQPRRLAG